MCSIYKNIDDGTFIGRKQDFVLMFQVNFLGLGLLFFFFIFLYIYTYNLKHNAALTHVTSFRLMTPRPVGLRALGVETPLRA
jgi:4-hydroxybenzoate polyprenyltransferase